MAFSDDVKKYGSVAAAFEAKGYTKNENGSWVAPSSTSNATSTGGTSSATSTGRNLNSNGYDASVDYSAAIEAEKAKGANANQAVINQLQTERDAKIHYQYGGYEPTMYGSNQTYKQLSGAAASGDSGAQTAINKAVQFDASDGANYFGANDIYKAAYQAAAAGDWDRAAALANQLEYQDAQGRGNLSETNRYLNQLQNLFGYDANAYYQQKYDAVYGQGAWDGGTGTGKPVYNDFSQALVDAYNQGLVPQQNGAGLPILSGGGTGGGPGGSGALSGTNPGLNLGGLINGGGTSSNVGNAYNPGSMGNYLDQWFKAAQQQQINQVDYGVNTAVAELIRQQQKAQAQFQEQRDQIAVDEAKAKDNQALYAERRGDKGGIGQAQYNAIMNTAAQNRLQVSQAQTQLATDTARQIADLRAQGEFEKADALLELSQTYLSQLMSLEQWSMEFGLSVAQFNASLQQWQMEFEMAKADLTGYYEGKPTLAYQKNLADQGWTMLSAGMPPTESQLAAMGLTGEQAQSYITAQKLAAQQKGSGGGGGGGDPAGDPAMTLTLAKEYAGQGIFNDAVVAALKKGNYSDELILSKYPEYEDYMRQKDLEAAGIETVMQKFDQEANAISSWLQQGKKGNADARVKWLLENGVIGEQEYALLADLYRRLGYEPKVTFE